MRGIDMKQETIYTDTSGLGYEIKRGKKTRRRRMNERRLRKQAATDVWHEGNNVTAYLRDKDAP
jgi:hypothetical protein